MYFRLSTAEMLSISDDESNLGSRYNGTSERLLRDNQRESNAVGVKV